MYNEMNRASSFITWLICLAIFLVITRSTQATTESIAQAEKRLLQKLDDEIPKNVLNVQENAL